MPLLEELSVREPTALNAPIAIHTRPRQIIHRTSGRRHGPITRLMSPSDFGEILKPFVFLDLFDTGDTSISGLGLHPHSGIITVTHLFEGSVRYEDTTGAKGTLPAGGVEWFKAAGGAWHGGGTGETGRTRGFQLWLALPTEHEHDPVESIYQAPGDIQQYGPSRVLVGAYDGVKSRLVAPSPLTYLAVRLKAGETWTFSPPADHAIAWIGLGAGKLTTPEPIAPGELVVFERSTDAIEFHAETDAEFVLGSAAPHPHDLVLGYYSVHTSSAALERGERQIAEIAQRLRQEGRL